MVSAYQPLGELLSALRRAGWGPLAGPEYRACRAILDALASNARWASLDRAGECVITTPQLADYAGYSDRHIRRWLPVLEDIGLIQWQRGGVVEGLPRPGVMRVVKRLIVRWIKDARPSNDKRIERRNQETRARLSKLRMLRIPPFRRKPLAHADTVSCPPPFQGRTGRPARPDDPKPHTPKPQKDYTMIEIEEYLPPECSHGKPEPRTCNACSYTAWLAKQDYDKAQREQAAQREAKAAAAEAEKASRWAAYMRTTYPGATRAQWARIVRDGKDPIACELVAS